MFSSTAKAALPVEGFLPNPKARLKEMLHEVCRFKHLAVRSEEAYWQWIKRFIFFQGNGRGRREESKTRYLVSYCRGLCE